MHNPSAFYSIEDIKNANQGVFTASESRTAMFKSAFGIRKGK
jgi:hypothetical protein